MKRTKNELKREQALMLREIRKQINKHNAISEKLRKADCYGRKLLQLTGWTTGKHYDNGMWMW